MRAWRGAALATFVLTGLCSARAHAEPADANDVKALEQQLDDAQATLSTSDCQLACRALASIRRAAERICALEPGSARCENARSKATAATKRVHDTCPDCAIATATELPPPAPVSPQAKEMASAPAPPAEEPRRGCASCRTAGSSAPPDLDVVLVALGAALAWRSSKRRRR